MRRLLAAAALLLGAAMWTPAIAAEGAVILMYHRFAEDEYPSTNIRLEQLDAHIEMLRSDDFNVVPLHEIIDAFESGTALPDRTVAITIDDAFRSIYEHAWPRFREAGFPFTVFVATELVDRGHANYMSWDQIRELHAAGVTIGNHSVSHPHMPDMDIVDVRREIVTAQNRFEQELGMRPDLFAYPYGEASGDIAELVRELGFRASFGQHSAVAFPAHDRHYLPRFALNETFGGMDRFTLIANARPMIMSDVSPADPTLRTMNPPPFGFTLDESLVDAPGLNCFAYAGGGQIDLTMQRLGPDRVEVRLAKAFPPGRARINCTMPADQGRWRWFGMQYYVPAR